MHTRLQTPLRIVLLAAAYFTVGKLSLLLAIPPGFATPVWPSAGIALAAVMLGGLRLLPGVVLGSFGVNLLISANAGGTVFTPTPILVAAGIALGAGLQAAVSALVLRRFLPLPSPMNKTRDIFAVLIIGGAFGCLINGAIGPAVLVLAGLIPESVYGLSVYTWWAGDAIGVALFTPLLLLAANPQVPITRKFVVSVPILAFAGLTALLFFGARADEQHRQQLDFSRQAAEVTAALRLDLNGYLDILTANENFMAASRNVTYDEYTSFTSEFLSKYPGIQSLAWLPRIRHEQRQAHVAAMKAEGFPDYRIYDRIALGQTVLAPERDEYFPVSYFVPKGPNLASAGLDTYGPDGVIGNVRKVALDRASSLARPIATAPLSLVQAETETGLIVYNPVFQRTSAFPERAQQPRGELLGFVAGVFRVGPMIEEIAARTEHLGMDLIISDLSAPPELQKFFDTRTASEALSQEGNESHRLQHQDVLSFGGHEWELRYLQKAAAAVSGQGWNLWYILIGGLLLSSLFGSFLMVISSTADAEPALHISDEHPRNALWLAVGSGTLVFIVSVLFVRHLEATEKQNTLSLLERQAELVADRLSFHSQQAGLTLRRLGNRSEMSGGLPEKTWIYDAGNLVEDIPFLRSVLYLEPDLRVRWQVPADIGDADALSALIDQARRELKSASVPFSSAGVDLFTPIPDEADSPLVLALARIEIGNQTQGYIAGLLDFNAPAAGVVPPGLEDAVRVRLTDHNVPIFDTFHGGERRGTYHSELVPAFNRQWTLDVAMKHDSALRPTAVRPRLIMIAGGMLALLTSFVVYIATAANYRSVMLRQKSRDLLHSEHRINGILENAGEGIYGFDLAGNPLFANPAALRILGHPESDVRKFSRHEFIRHVHVDGTPIAPEDSGILAVLVDGKIHSSDEEAFFHKNGYALPVEYTSAPLRDDNGSTIGVVVVFRDITERKRAENELIAANTELEEFAYRTSHDLRSPLVSSTELLNLTREFYKEGDIPQAEKCLDMAQGGLRKLDTLVQDIMLLSRTKNMQEDASDVDIEELVQSAIAKVAHLQNFDKIRIETHIDLPGPVRLRRSRIAVIVENLISNAIKYLDPQSESPSLNISATKQSGHLTLVVEDNGLGIPEFQRDKLFGMFKRFHSEVSFGSGLGLYMVRKSADVLGGEIHYEPREPGARFTFSMPWPERTMPKT